MMDKVAVITGGGTGIGGAVAARLAGKRWKLALLGRRRDRLDATAAALDGDPLVLACDVSDAAAVEAAFEAIERRFGRVDLLFNNAGIGAPARDVDDYEIATWDRVVGVNLSGAFYCARSAFGIMKRQRPQGGRIINNGSVSAQAPRPRSAAYTTTKHALTDMAIPMTKGMPQADGSTRAEPTIDVAHVADAVALMAELPLDANIPFMTIMASKMPLVGRG